VEARRVDTNGRHKPTVAIVKPDLTKSLKWRKRFFAYLETVSHCRVALEKLKNAGCDEDNLLYWLKLYSTSAKRINQKRKASRASVKEIQKCLTALQKASKCLSALRLHPHFAFTTYSALYGQKDLEERLARYQESLRSMEDEYKRIGSERGEGRDEEMLVTLSLIIRRDTGRKHYAELRDLLEAAAQAEGLRFPDELDTVRKIVSRFRDRYPILYRSIEDFYGRAPVDAVPRLKKLT
jgi:hypothetical protein